MKRRTLALTAGIALLLVVAAALTVYWASRSEALLRWAIAHASHRLPGELSVEGIAGSLVQPVTIKRVRYQQAGSVVEADDVTLSWAPWELIANQHVHIVELRIRELAVRLAGSGAAGPPKFPDNLSPPVSLQIDRLLIDTLTVRNTDALLFSATQLQLNYAGDARAHKLKVENITTPWGSIAASAQLGTRAPFALDGQAAFRGTLRPQWPAAAQVEMRGTLATADLVMRGNLRSMPVTVSALLAPVDPTPVRILSAKIQEVDLKPLIAGAPQTRIEAHYDAKSENATALTGTLLLTNAMPGTIDQGRAPVKSLEGQLTVSRDALKLSAASVDLASAGKAAVVATIAGNHSTVSLSTTRLDLRGIHSALRPTHLSGTASAAFGPDEQQYRGELTEDKMRIAFLANQSGHTLIFQSAQLQAGNASIAATGKLDLDTPNAVSAHGALSRFDPAAFGDFPAADINGNFDIEGTLRPNWRLSLGYRLASSTFRGQPLSGTGRLSATADQLSGVDARLALANNRLQVNGSFGQSRDVLQFNLDAPALKALGSAWSGNLHARGSISGNWARPGFDVVASATQLSVPGGYAAKSVQLRGNLLRDEQARFEITGEAQGLQVRGQTAAAAQVHARGSEVQHSLEMRLLREGIDLQASAQGGWSRAARTWSGRVTRLDNRGDYPLHLIAPASVEVARDHLALGAARVDLAGGRLSIGELRYIGNELAASGELSALPVATVLKWTHAPSALDTTLVVGGRWNINVGEHVNGNIELHREAGDVRITVEDERLTLQLVQLGAELEVVNDALRADVRLEGKRLGRLNASARTRLTQRDGRWGISGRAPLWVAAQADIATLKPIAALLSKSISADGRLMFTLKGEGTVAQPNLRGRLEAQQLAFEQVENGVLLHDGVAHATFDEHGLELTEFTIGDSSGRFHATGQVRPSKGHIDAHLDWKADHLAAVQRPDLSLTLSGAGTLAYQNERTSLEGRVHVDRGRVELRSGGAPALGNDVVVVGEKKSSGAKAKLSEARVDLNLDLGPDFLVTGNGLNARVEGKLHVQSPGQKPFTAQGEISIVRGTYEAYGHKLEIEKGTFYFTGPLDNPGLNIRAMRKNQQVEAGVEVTGTVHAPVVRLVSNPEVPDTDKLAWLVLGHKADTGGHTDSQALQNSAALLLADVGTSPLQKQIAQRVGLDELSVSSSETSSTGGVVTLGKRISERIYVIFERGLGVATSAVKVNYQLSRHWSLRTESGRTDAIDIFYSISWD